MKSICLPVLAILAVSTTYAFAQEPVFVETADAIVDELVDQQPRYGKTRGFKLEKTRAIAVRVKNDSGREETMTVKVPENSIHQGAKLKVEFDVNSAQLRPSAYTVLGELATAVQDQQIRSKTICVKGHTDSDGTDSYNLKLSYARAHAVKSYLQGEHGISAERMGVFGYGEHLPLVPNNAAHNKQINRRVEISLACSEIESTQ